MGRSRTTMGITPLLQTVSIRTCRMIGNVYEVVPPFAMECANHMLRKVKDGNRKVPRVMLDLLTDTSFDTNKFKIFIKSIYGREKVCTRRAKKMVESEGTTMISVSDGGMAVSTMKRSTIKV